MMTPDDAVAIPGLTAREDRILELIGEGLTNREIGAELGLAEQTVKNAITLLLAKLGMRRRSQAAVYAAVRQLRVSRGGQPASAVGAAG